MSDTYNNKNASSSETYSQTKYNILLLSLGISIIFMLLAGLCMHLMSADVKITAIFCLISLGSTTAFLFFMFILSSSDELLDVKAQNDLLKTVTGIQGALLLCLVLFVGVHFGETEKPIEQLNGVYLGHTYDADDFKKDGNTVITGTPSSRYAFKITDDKDPTMTTYVYMNDKQEVTSVTVAYGSLKNTESREAEAKLRELARNQYGGKTTQRGGYLFDGKIMLDTYHGDDYAGITIYPVHTPEEDNNKARREMMSLEIRAIDAVQGNAPIIKQ